MTESLATASITAESLLRQVEGLYPPQAVDQIRRAAEFSLRAHGEQARASGEPFFTHPLEVAAILLDLQMDAPSIAAGLLHDVLEDTAVTYDGLKQEFGDAIATLVEGVTKLRRVKRKSRVETVDLDEGQAENLRKMVLAMVDDIRVVIIKLADRLHNVRTLQYLPEEAQRRKARETLDVFAPLANRLGIWQLKWQLEDLSFRYLNPERYHQIARLLAERRVERAAYLERAMAILKEKLDDDGLSYRITGRPKHIYSIYRKMEEKSREFDEIYDLLGVRIIVRRKVDCYHALGIVHSLWRPIPGEFDDYIATPKDNLYQSLHTAVIALDGKPLEVQIRTEEMHRIAEYGVAAHWRYKEGVRRDENLEAKVNWLRQATEWRSEVADARQFVDSLKSDVFGERVYVFTPKGDIVDLPAESTPVDFAYQIHSEIGHRCRGAKVDGRLVSLDYQLQTGEQVEIITAKQGGPSRDWLNPQLGYVATQRARQKIRQWFRHQERDQNIAAGREILDDLLRRLGLDQESYAGIATMFKYDNVDDFFEAVGYHEISPAQLVRKIDDAAAKDEDYRLKSISESPISDIAVRGVGDLLTRLAPCCKPVPGDPIVGYITRGKGVTVHRADCSNIAGIRETERMIPVSWGKVHQEYPVAIQIEALDRNGLLRDVAAVAADQGLNLTSVNVTTNQDHTAVINLTVAVQNLSQLATLMTRLEKVRDVLDVRRRRSA